MKVVQRKIKKSGKDRKRIGRGGSAYILDKRRITAVQNMKREAEKEKLRERCGVRGICRDCDRKRGNQY